jgi:hypothetical protein
MAEESAFDSRQGPETFFHSNQVDSEVHPSSYPMGTGGLFAGDKGPAHEADHSSAEVTNGEAIATSTPPNVFMAWCLII